MDRRRRRVGFNAHDQRHLFRESFGLHPGIHHRLRCLWVLFVFPDIHGTEDPDPQRHLCFQSASVLDPLVRRRLFLGIELGGILRLQRTLYGRDHLGLRRGRADFDPTTRFEEGLTALFYFSKQYNQYIINKINKYIDKINLLI